MKTTFQFLTYEKDPLENYTVFPELIQIRYIYFLIVLLFFIVIPKTYLPK